MVLHVYAVTSDQWGTVYSQTVRKNASIGLWFSTNRAKKTDNKEQWVAMRVRLSWIYCPILVVLTLCVVLVVKHRFAHIIDSKTSTIASVTPQVAAFHQIYKILAGGGVQCGLPSDPECPQRP
jgi:hypothetical protein